jgi:iron complex transport system substrate-binding protein
LYHRLTFHRYPALSVTRIVSLLPAATEMVCALGAADELVGISHQCDYPPAVTGLPRVTLSALDPSLGGGDIDAAVRALRAEGQSVIGVDLVQLRRLQPELILTQDLCEVCAVSDGEVYRLAESLDPPPRMVSLLARDLAEIWLDIEKVGIAIARVPQAASLVGSLRARMASLPAAAAESPRPRVVCVEWLDPLYLAGHWVPRQIEAAGGRDVGAAPGSHSIVTTWENVERLDPELVMVAICGFGLERSFKELASLADNHWLNSTRCPVWVLDGNAYTSRAGPRVVDGAALIQSAILGMERPGLRRYQPSSPDYTDAADSSKQEPLFSQ